MKKIVKKRMLFRRESGLHAFLYGMMHKKNPLYQEAGSFLLMNM